jgi:hypothetical protein
LFHGTILTSAGRWLLQSGIQTPSCGFARFYDANTGRNRAVSTEITGYAASALVWLFNVTGDEEYLVCARRTAGFLLTSWNSELGTFPFEHPSPSPESEHLSYFFDCGIIIRGLLAVWHETHDDRLLDIARRASHGMIDDFHAQSEYHPILNLPDKSPVGRTEHWSRSAGCYQLKAALAWRDVAAITGDPKLNEAWSEMLESALAKHEGFLPGASCNEKVMDRLHPFCYFLEGLLPELERTEVRTIYAGGLRLVAEHLRNIAPVFSRSDVYAQLLRARLYAARAVPVDEPAAAHEAAELAAYRVNRSDPRTDGGFVFGRRGAALIQHVNPVSTVFAIQALEMWREYQTAGSKPPCLRLLI